MCLFILVVTFEASRWQQDYQMTDVEMVEMSQSLLSTAAPPDLERRFTASVSTCDRSQIFCQTEEKLKKSGAAAGVTIQDVFVFV